ncbi:MAG: DNA translocase FtsK, partial [Acholeplasmataceae bacterium]
KKMPHGLIAGATNSGKSVCVNTIIMSLLMKNHPDDLKFIMIDPKMVELSIYDGIPHLVTPVITEPKMAATALTWATQEMDSRFLRFSKARVKDLEGFNEKASTDPSLEKMPYIIIVIDELADLMMVSANDVEDAIQRITQKARAAGIHLLVATQRPTTDVVKGTIKANIPTRIAFKVSSFTDSSVILDQQGAEQLLGRGDMLLKTIDRPMRLQGAYIKDSEIEAVTSFIKDQMEPIYLIDHKQLKEFKEKIEVVDSDDLFLPVAQYVVSEQNASINAIQKEFGIGFNRAQRIVELLEKEGIVGVSEGTKARQVLVTQSELEDMLS